LDEILHLFSCFGILYLKTHQYLIPLQSFVVHKANALTPRPRLLPCIYSVVVIVYSVVVIVYSVNREVIHNWQWTEETWTPSHCVCIKEVLVWNLQQILHNSRAPGGAHEAVYRWVTSEWLYLVTPVIECVCFPIHRMFYPGYDSSQFITECQHFNKRC